MDRDAVSYYYWKESKVLPASWGNTFDNEVSGLYCYDPRGTDDMRTWGIWSARSHVTGVRRWECLGRAVMPKDFVFSLLLMGVFDAG